MDGDVQRHTSDGNTNNVNGYFLYTMTFLWNYRGQHCFFSNDVPQLIFYVGCRLVCLLIPQHRKRRHQLVRSQSLCAPICVTWSLCQRWLEASLVSTMARPSTRLRSRCVDPCTHVILVDTIMPHTGISSCLILFLLISLLTPLSVFVLLVMETNGRHRWWYLLFGDVQPEMVSHYLGEFSISYKPVRHGRPGIGATHSSRFIPLK